MDGVRDDGMEQADLPGEIEMGGHIEVEKFLIDKPTFVTAVDDFEGAAIEPRCVRCGKELFDDIDWGFRRSDGLPTHFDCAEAG